MNAFASGPQFVVVLSAGAAVAAVVVLMAGLYALGRNAAAAGTDESSWRPPALVEFVYRLVGPIVDQLAHQKVRPNHVTAFALAVALATGASLAFGQTLLGAFLLVATGLCDLLDGHLARQLEVESAAGAFFDSFADRLAESFILGGLAYLGAGGWLTGLSIWALVASMVISYARARGEGLGVEAKIGVMQRPERMVVLTLTVFVAALAPLWAPSEPIAATIRVEIVGVGLLAVLATATAIRRAWSTFTMLRADGVSGSEDESPSSSRSEPPSPADR